MSDQYPPERTVPTSSTEIDDEEEDDEQGVQYVSSTRPGMVAVRRRSRRRRSSRTSTSDYRSRQIRIGLLILIVAMLAFNLSGHSVHAFTYAIAKQVFRPIYGFVVGLHLEVVALVVAAAVLIYLTPGVEDSVLKVFGIKRTPKRR